MRARFLNGDLYFAREGLAFERAGRLIEKVLPHGLPSCVELTARAMIEAVEKIERERKEAES